MQMRGQYQKDGKKKTALKKSNVFFHMRDLGCVWQITEFAYVECDHIYITNKDFVELTCMNTLIYLRNATIGIT